MKHIWKIAAAAALVATGAQAEMITTKTDKSVIEAMDALEAAVTGAGATVFARVDHTAGAQSAGLSMDEAQTLIFGNPKLGTPAMNDDIRASLYLPLKVAIYSPEEGGVVIAYDDPAGVFSDLDIPQDAKYLKMMQGALAKLTQAAAN
jgi:uncharacterized protein (DUF302 family)